MAEFSKQYWQKQNDDHSGDFDIIEEFNKLEEEDSISFICEGFGFHAIGKPKDSLTPKLLFSFHMAIQEGYWNKPIPEGLNEDDAVWIDYSELK